MKNKSGNRAVKSTSRTITFAIAFAIFVIYSLYILYFLFFAVVLAIKPSESFILDKMNGKLFSFASGVSFKNFIIAFKEFEIGSHSYLEMTFNSIWYSAGSTFIGWMCCAMVTYILVFFRNKFTKFLYFLGFFLSTLPLYGAGPAEYKLFTQLHMINSPLILIQNITLYGGYFFYMYAFWKAISWEYAEAAKIDGAGDYSVFFKIMFPMAVPSMMALFIMNFITFWNSYDSILLYMTEYPTLSYALYVFETNTKYNSKLGKPIYFAGMLISLLPILILFMTFQNTIMERVYLGGLKG